MFERTGGSLMAVLPAAGCTVDSASPLIFESSGPYPVGNSHFEIVAAARSRTLWVEVWYPAAEGHRAAAVAAFFSAILKDEKTGLEYLDAPRPANLVQVGSR